MTIAHFKHLTEQALPDQARIHRWPIRLDHCFKRICLDHAFGGVWHQHIPRPAERHLTGEALARAIACAEQILDQGLPLLSERNAASLRYRGKPPQTRIPFGNDKQERQAQQLRSLCAGG